MLIYAFGSWAITLFNLVLWTLTLAKSRLSPLARAYFWWSFYITLWSFGYGITLCGWFDYGATLIWNKWCQAMAILIAPYFFRFGCVVADEFERYRNVYRAYLLFAIINAFGLFFTPYYVKGLWSFGVFRYQPLGGPLYIVFAAFFWWCTLHSFLVAARKYKETVGTKKPQVRLFLLATGIAYSGGGELFFQGFRIPIPSFGIFPILAYVIIIGYAVHRYRFLNVELVLKKAVVFTGLSAFILGTVTFATFFLQEVISHHLQVQSWVLTLAAAIIVVTLYDSLKTFLVNATERFLFQKKYDYRELLKTFTNEVMTVLDLRRLVELTTTTLHKTIKLDSCALLLPSRVTNRYEVTAVVGKAERGVALEETHPLVKYLQQTQEPVVKEPARKDQETPMKAVEETLAQLKAEVCFPLAMRDELVGILALGHKKSDEPYTKEDLEILTTLTKTLAIAISNALLAAEAAQKEKLAVIGTLAAAINHEVCNPLNNIKVQAEGFVLQLQRGFLRQLSREDLEQKMTQIMQTTMSEIDRTAAITTRLSNFAKPMREPVTEPVKLGKVVEEVYSLLGHDLELREIAMEWNVPADIPPLLVDQRQLQEILFNLVRNAGQAIGQKGKVTVRSYRNGDARVVVEVADTGPGIPPETLARLFTPFFTTKEEGKGTGLGLFVIKRLVERNEGTISVNSTVGVGSVFTLEFPAALVAKAAEGITL